jgi:predicted Ser/Thr protein kinase
VKNKTTLQEAVMKIFPTKKSPKTIEKEIRLQKKFYPLAPQIYKEGKNYFIMEKGHEVTQILHKNPQKINQFISSINV